MELKSNLKQDPRFVRLTLTVPQKPDGVFSQLESKTENYMNIWRDASGLCPTALRLRVNPDLSAQKPHNTSTSSPLLEFPLNSAFFLPMFYI